MITTARVVNDRPRFNADTHASERTTTLRWITCIAKPTALDPDRHGGLTVAPGHIDRKAGKEPCHPGDIAMARTRLMNTCKDAIIHCAPIDMETARRSPP